MGVKFTHEMDWGKQEDYTQDTHTQCQNFNSTNKGSSNMEVMDLGNPESMR
jgi:hypothetical protein